MISLEPRSNANENNTQYEIIEILQCSGTECQAKLQKIRDMLSECESKIAAAKEKYHQALVDNLKKDVLIRQLEAALQKSKYDEFHEIFGDEIIERLRLLSSDPEKDSTFIRTAMEGLYKDDFSRLKTMSYSGYRTKKQKMPQADIDVLRKLFILRLEHQNNYVDRLANFTKHIKNGIENISKKTSS